MQQQSRALVSVPHNPIQALSQEAAKFYQFHGVQLLGNAFPPHLIENLYLKLSNAVYDGGEYFQIQDNEQAESFQVHSKSHITAKCNVFVIDHALTFRYPDLRQLLKSNPNVLERLRNMLKYQQEKPVPGGETELKKNQEEELEFDNMNLMDLSVIQLPKTLVTLSLIGNKLENVEELISKLQYVNLRALWLNGNPLADNEELTQYVATKTRIQIFNSKFTRHCTEWGLKYASCRDLRTAAITENGKIVTLNLDNRNIFTIDVSLFQNFINLRSLSLKGHQIANQKELSILTRILSNPSLRFVYVDQQVQKCLRQAASKGQLDASVTNRILINKHSFAQELCQGDELLDQICYKIFRLAGCYRLASSQKLDESSCWYINDELGSCISHSDHPNVKIVPFLYAPQNALDESVVAYSILWPLEDVGQGQIITRDYLNGFSQQKQRSARLAAWYRLQEPTYLGLIQHHDFKMLQLSGEAVSLLEQFYSQNAVKQKEGVGKIESYDKKLRVLSDYEYINKYLKHQRFQIVSSLEEADIIWLTAAAEEQEWQKYKQKYFLNQFPFESCIVMKHNLADTVQTVLGDTKFLMRTYDLEKELDLFVGDFYKREKEGQDNLWILKPPNMARSMDMIITDNLTLIVRAMETGPKIAQKYISQPVLRRARKVDLRYILLVKSISPLTLFLYKNFWIRSANNEYTLDRRHLSTYETQFTVMNYGKVSNFQQIKYQDFIEQFQKDYKVKWVLINEKIKKMLRNVFIAVATKYPEMHDQKSRAVYGIDIMIDSATMEPKLLQITFSPDCKRACEYYPTFYDDVFHSLFLETMSENMERII